ncbi:MAG: PAS domain S-box protein [Ignavibacteriaceae bacterium]
MLKFPEKYSKYKLTLSSQLFSVLQVLVNVAVIIVIVLVIVLNLNKADVLQLYHSLFSNDILMLWGIFFLVLLLTASGLIIMLKKQDYINRKKTEDNNNALESSEKRFKAVIDHSPVAIVEFTNELVISQHNPALKDIIKTEKDNLIGENLRQFFSKDFIEIFQKAIFGIEKNFEGWHKSSDKSVSKFISVSTAPVQNKENSALYGVGVIQDITLRKSAEAELKKVNRYFRLTSRSNRSLLKAETEIELIENICSVLVDEGGYAAASVAYINDTSLSGFRRVYSKGDLEIDKLFSDRFIQLRNRHTPFLTSIKLNKPITFYADELFEDGTNEFGTKKTFVLPLDGTGSPFGILVLQREKNKRLEPEELELINEIASDLAFGLSRFEVETKHTTVRSALFESEEKFRNLINSIDDIVFTLDTNKKYQGLYGKWFEKTGIKPHLFLGKDSVEIFGEEKGKVHIAAAEKVLAGENATYEWNHTENDKTEYFLTTLSPIFGADGNVNGIVGVGKSITEIKESALALEREHIRTKIYLDNTSDGFTMYDKDGEIIECNKSFKDMTGIRGVDKKFYNLNTFIPECSSLYDFIKGSSTKTGESNLCETELVNSDGKSIPVEISTNKLTLHNKEFFISSIRDLSSRKSSEVRLDLLSRAIENSPAGVIITDAEANIEYVNKRYEELIGFSAGELIGKNTRVLKSGSNKPGMYEDLWKKITSGQDWDGELLNKKKTGELYWEHALISPMIDAKGQTTHYIAIKEDITQKKEMERALIEAKEKAEELNKLKSNFLANMSHELRTPMIGILGYSELLQTELQNNPELKELAGVINRGGIRLMETLNLILDLSRIESGNLEINYAPIELNELINESIELYEETARRKNLLIGSKFIHDSIKVCSDSRLLSLSINNLIDNAIKFTVKGVVTISSKTQSIGEKEFVVINVDDTGIGIPTDKQQIIFDEFRQVSEGYSRSFEGNGLGLSLTKKAVEILGGTISVDSHPGVGSTFQIKLPANSESCN